MPWPKTSCFDLPQMIPKKGKGAFAAQVGGVLVIAGPMITNETMARPVVDVDISVRFGISRLIYILHRDALVIGAEMKLHWAGGVSVQEVMNKPAVVS